MRLESMFRAVVVLVMTYIFSLGATFNGVLIPDLKVFDLLLIAIFGGLWVVVHRLSRRWRWYHTDFDYVIVVWGGAIAISLLANLDDWRRIVIGMWYVSLYVLVWYALSDAIANRSLKRDMLVDGLLFAGFVIVFFGYIQLRSVTFDLASLDFPRPGSLIGNPNSLGAFLVVLIPLAAGRFFAIRNRLARGILGVYLLAALVMLLLTFSRGAWIGAAAAFVALAYFVLDASGLTSWGRIQTWWIARTGRTRTLMSLGGVTVILVLVFIGAILLQSLSISGRSFELRTRIWEDAITAIGEQPFTGHGLFTFGKQHERLESSPPFQPHSHAHNVILHVTAEMGVVGVIALLVTVAIVLRMIRRNWRDVRDGERFNLAGAVAAVVGFGVHHLLDTPFMMPTIALTGLVALVLAITPYDPQPMREWWRRTGHPVGIGVLYVIILVTGFWSANVYTGYVNALNHVNDGEYRAAAEAIQSAIDADPEMAIYHGQQAYLYGVLASAGDLDAARRAVAGYERYLDLEPQSAVGWTNLAALQWQLDDRTAALDSMRRTVELAPDDWRLWALLGDYAERLGNDELARQAYIEALDERAALYPFWQETALRRDVSGSFTPSPVDAFLLDNTQVQLPDDLRDVPRDNYARLVAELRRDDPDETQIDALLSAVSPTPDDVVDEAWRDLARATVADSRGDSEGAARLREDARSRLMLDVVDVDYSYGANIGYFQFLRFVIPRSFIPQVHFPIADPILLRLLEQ